MALFGKTAAQWRNEKGISTKTPNIRGFASVEELVVFINLEDTNADLIRQGMPQIKRLKLLRENAMQLYSLNIEGFRKHIDTKIIFSDPTFLIGENNVGKSSILLH